MTKLSKPNLQAFLFAQGIPLESLSIPVDYYSLWTDGFIMGPFSNAFMESEDSLDRTYTSGENQCTTFANRCKAFADETFLHDPNAPKDTAIAFAEFRYIKTNGDGHSINAAVTRYDEELKLRFYDPQLCIYVTLSRSEVSSCVACIF